MQLCSMQFLVRFVCRWWITMVVSEKLIALRSRIDIPALLRNVEYVCVRVRRYTSVYLFNHFPDNLGALSERDRQSCNETIYACAREIYNLTLLFLHRPRGCSASQFLTRSLHALILKLSFILPSLLDAIRSIMLRPAFAISLIKSWVLRERENARVH